MGARQTSQYNSSWSAPQNRTRNNKKIGLKFHSISDEINSNEKVVALVHAYPEASCLSDNSENFSGRANCFCSERTQVR